MVAMVVLARKLTVADYGVYNLFIGSTLIFNFFTNFGLAYSLQRFLPDYAKLKKDRLFFRTFFFFIGFRSLAGIFVFATAILLFDRFAGYFGVPAYKYDFILFCLATYALFQIDFLQFVFNALFLHNYSSITQLVYQSLRVGSFVVLLVLLQGGLPEVFTGELFSYGFGAVLLWFFLIKRVYIPKKDNLIRDRKNNEWKRLLRYSAYSAATIPGSVLFSTTMDYFVVAAMATTNQLGVYALGSRAANMLLSIMPQSLLQTVIRPAFYHQYSSAKEKQPKLIQMFRTLVVLIAAFLLPILALVGIHAEAILTFIFKSKFAEATPVFIMFLAFNIFKAIELPSDLVLQATEQVQFRFYAQIFAVYNIVAAILLMPKFGLLGVAFATGSALMGKCLFWYFMARLHAGVSLCWGALLKILVNTSVAVVVAYLVNRFGQSTYWMFASLMAGIVVYVILAFLNPFFDDREKELINRFCKRQVFNV